MLVEADDSASSDRRRSRPGGTREHPLRVPEVPLILDHCGKPGIKEGAIDQFRDDVAVLFEAPNMWIKLSDLPVEADLDNWTEADLRPYIAATLDAFGPDRTIYAGDYPILHQATTMPRMGRTCSTARSATSACHEAETRAIYRDNANALLPPGAMTQPVASDRLRRAGARTPGRIRRAGTRAAARSRSRSRTASSAW